jgi:hypothetical protein
MLAHFDPGALLVAFAATVTDGVGYASLLGIATVWFELG